MTAEQVRILFDAAKGDRLEALYVLAVTTGLRHTCATLLLTENVNPKIVSEMMGHASIAITLDTYSHVLPNVEDSAAKAMEDALS